MAGLSTTNKAADIILSAGNIEAESNSTAGGGIVLSDIGHAAGRWYYESEKRQDYSAGDWCGVGMHAGVANLSTWLGSDANAWAAWDNGSNLATFFAGGSANATAGDVAVYHRIRMAADIGAGKLWLAYPGGAWIGGGDPEAGTTPTYAFSPSGIYYAALCPRYGHGSTATDRNRLRFCAQPEDWHWPAPAGFAAWDSAYTVSGTVTDDGGNPCARTVLVYHRPTGSLVGRVTSDVSTGAWSCPTPYNDAHLVAFLDDAGGTTYNDLVVGQVTPI